MRNPNSGDAIDFLFPGESNTSLQNDLEKSQSCHTFLIYDYGLVINCISERVFWQAQGGLQSVPLVLSPCLVNIHLG